MMQIAQIVTVVKGISRMSLPLPQHASIFNLRQIDPVISESFESSRNERADRPVKSVIHL
jgi:hypothetical protein